MTARRVLTAFAGALLLCLLSCAFLPRYRAVAPGPTPWPEDDLMASMDPWLLGDRFADRVTIEVDWVEGCRPGPATIEGLRAILVKYGPAGRPVEITLDDEIPRAAWDEPEQPGEHDRVQRLVERFADLAAEPHDPGFRAERRYVLFAPGAGAGYYGYSSSWNVTRGEESVQVNGVVVFRDPHARFAWLWLSLDKMERMTLVHEFGHQLGLVHNKTHERTGHHRGHCTDLSCLMAHPTPRVIARNFLPGLFNVFMCDYCPRCQEDIRRAQAAWRDRMARDPAYRAGRAAERESRRLATSLWLLFKQGRHEEVLARVEEAGKRYGGSPPLRSLEMESLVALGRVEEALVRLRAAEASGSSLAERLRLSWPVGRALNASGRYDEAMALFDLEDLHRADEYEFEQSSFVLLDALEGAGRLEEELALMDELLVRSDPISFQPEGMGPRRALLLQRLGRLDEAEDAARRGLRSRKSRRDWLSPAAEILKQGGRLEEADALLREWLGDADTALRKATTPESRWRWNWTVAEIHARLGEKDLARQAIARAGPVPEGTRPYVVLWVQTPALAALGEWDRLAGLMRDLPSTWRALYDPCVRPDVAPMRSDPRYSDIFAHCPPPR